MKYLAFFILLFSGIGCDKVDREYPPCPDLPKEVLVYPNEFFPYFPYDHLSKDDTAYFVSENDNDTLIYDCVGCSPAQVRNTNASVGRYCYSFISQTGQYFSKKHKFSITCRSETPLAQTPVNGRYYSYVTLLTTIADTGKTPASSFRGHFYMNHQRNLRSLAINTLMSDSGNVFDRGGFKDIIRIESDTPNQFLYLQKNRGIVGFSFRGKHYYRTR